MRRIELAALTAFLQVGLAGAASRAT